MFAFWHKCTRTLKHRCWCEWGLAHRHIQFLSFRKISWEFQQISDKFDLTNHERSWQAWYFMRISSSLKRHVGEIYYKIDWNFLFHKFHNSYKSSQKWTNTKWKANGFMQNMSLLISYHCCVVGSSISNMVTKGLRHLYSNWSFLDFPSFPKFGPHHPVHRKLFEPIKKVKMINY